MCGWGQVLDRIHVQLCVTALLHHQERSQQKIMIAGDVGGNLTAFTLGDTLWKLVLPEMGKVAWSIAHDRHPDGAKPDAL